MKTRKTRGEPAIIPAPDWVRQVGRETGAFEVTSVTQSKPQHAGWDFIITLAVRPDQRPVDLYVESKLQFSPQAALATFEQLKSAPRGVLAICSPYIPPRVAELCRENHVSYLDGVGNCRIEAPGLFVHISGRPNRSASVKAVIDPFSRKSSRIVRTLLKHPLRGWQVQQLAREADVSMGLASKVKKALIDEAYLEERDRLLYPRDPAKLLQAWVIQYRPHVKRLPLFTLSRPPEVERRLAEWCRANEVAYALTQLAAAWRYLPMVRYDKSVSYIEKKVALEDHLTALLAHLDARQVDTGANCTLWLTDDPAVLSDAREIEGINIVSPVQLYLDLRNLPGRGEEVAQDILRRELPSLLPDSEPPNRQQPGG
jgi:hypothetical protein